MTLPELCEPFFDYVCRLNRMGRKNADLDEIKVRTDLTQMLKDLASQAEQHPRVLDQFRRVELPLIFFADSAIAESKLPFASRWNNNRMAYDRKELAGDEKFFDLLEETMQEHTEDSNERLRIFYTCLGLGFTGWYAGQIDYLRSKMNEIANRIGVRTSPGHKEQICPESYQNIDGRDLIEPPGGGLAGLVFTFLGLIAFLVIMNMLIFRQAKNQINEYLQKVQSFEQVLIEDAEEPVVPAPAP